MEKEILKLILDKLDLMDKDIKEIKDMQSDIMLELEDIKKQVKEINSIQDTVKEFIASAEEIIEEDHRFIQRLKKAVGE